MSSEISSGIALQHNFTVSFGSFPEIRHENSARIPSGFLGLVFQNPSRDSCGIFSGFLRRFSVIPGISTTIYPVILRRISSRVPPRTTSRVCLGFFSEIHSWIFQWIPPPISPGILPNIFCDIPSGIVFTIHPKISSSIVPWIGPELLLALLQGFLHGFHSLLFQRFLQTA